MLPAYATSNPMTNRMDPPPVTEFALIGLHLDDSPEDSEAITSKDTSSYTATCYAIETC